MKQHFNIRLSRKQRKHLTKIYKSKTGKASERAHMVLLYTKGYSPKEIAEICMRNINVVYTALRRFSEDKFDGLYDKPRSGATRKLSEEDEKYLFSCLEKSPEILFFPNKFNGGAGFFYAYTAKLKR